VCPNQGSLAEKGRISTIDLLFWQLVKSTPFYTEKLFGFITKQLNAEVNCIKPSHSVSVPCPQQYSSSSRMTCQNLFFMFYLQQSSQKP